MFGLIADLTSINRKILEDLQLENRKSKEIENENAESLKESIKD